MDKNLETYSSKNVVSYYEKYENLQKPEEKIMELLRPNLSEMNMLDIGIGAGRTTRYFAPLVKNYTGIDYSQGMVDTCIKRFDGKLNNSTFYREDARTLENCKDNSFDFILFSFNGIDYVAPEEREKIFFQIKRALKPDGFFCFSTHNINSLVNMPAFEFRLNIPAAIKRVFEVRKIKKINKEQLKKVSYADYVTINDGAHNYSLETCYIRTPYQISELKKIGFAEIKVFSLLSGQEIKTKNQLDSNSEKWLYYLCGQF